MQDFITHIELLHLIDGITDQLLPVPPLDHLVTKLLKPGLTLLLLATIPKNSEGQAIRDVLATVTGMVGHRQQVRVLGIVFDVNVSLNVTLGINPYLEVKKLH